MKEGHLPPRWRLFETYYYRATPIHWPLGFPVVLRAEQETVAGGRVVYLYLPREVVLLIDAVRDATGRREGMGVVLHLVAMYPGWPVSRIVTLHTVDPVGFLDAYRENARRNPTA